jgi:VIT1/CCC1 family predicted Fe2+/Mn2+ transporter
MLAPLQISHMPDNFAYGCDILDRHASGTALRTAPTANPHAVGGQSGTLVMIGRGVRLQRLTFGSTSAVVTSIGLVVGFASTRTSRATLIAGLLIVGIADNLTDSLSVHLYQEAEGLESQEAFVSTVTNFVARLAITATFIALVATLEGGWLIAIVTIWGLALLGILTVALAHQRHVPVFREIVRHFAIAIAVIALSRAIGVFVNANFG